MKKTARQSRQQARELAMAALAEKMERQKKIQEATQQAFLAQSQLEDVQHRFAAALQELDRLGESQVWIKESFGLTPSQLRNFLALEIEGEERNAVSENEESANEVNDMGGESNGQTDSDVSFNNHTIYS